MSTRNQTPRSIELERRISEALTRAGVALDASEVRRRIGGDYTQVEVSRKMGNMSMFDTLYRVGTVHTQKGRVPTYAIRPAGRADRPARTWAPMRPIRPTVIPVRERGRMAPDVSDGLIVSMVSRVSDTRRVER